MSSQIVAADRTIKAGRLFGLWVLVGSALLVAGCGGAAATTAAEPTGEVVTATPEPADGLTGDAALDPVITAVTNRDRQATAALIQFSETTCTTAEGLGGPPKCAEGQPDGTPVTVFPVLGPGEGSYNTPETMEDLLDFVLPAKLEGLYAVYRMRDDTFDADYWPAGEYGVLFTLLPADDPLPLTTLTLYVEGGRIVRAGAGLDSAAAVVEREAGEMVLGPPSG